MLLPLSSPCGPAGRVVGALPPSREGKLPGVIYGKKFDPIPIVLDLHDASRILAGLSASHLVVVEVDGVPHTSLVREKQRNPITGGLLHVDFQQVSMTEKLRTVVPLEIEGESPAVKNYNGVLVTGQEEIEVEALPGDLPSQILVDISGLEEIGDSLHVRDLVIPDKVRVLSDPDDLIVLVTAPAVEVEAVEAAAEFAEPEVIEKGKKEEEEF